MYYNTVQVLQKKANSPVDKVNYTKSGDLLSIPVQYSMRTTAKL